MAKKPKKPKPAKCEGRFKHKIDGHALTGEKWGGKWVLSCPSFPEVERHSGGADASPALEEFTQRALGLYRGENVRVPTATEEVK